MRLLGEKGSLIVWLGILVVVFILGGGLGIFYFRNQTKDTRKENFKKVILPDEVKTNEASPVLSENVVDVSKLPLGNNRTSTSAKKGYIFSCQSQFNGGGAFKVGPWIDEMGKTWDLNKKLTVDGSVSWANSKINVTSNGTTRSFISNGLPYHVTGVFPISSSDDAYEYDRNPNSIREQDLDLELPAKPTLLSMPECVGGEVGIMLSGIPIFNGFDAGGRDAVAYEIQDKCGGHPQVSGQYHYHGLSSCLRDMSTGTEHSTLEGYAFDGFGIYGIKGEGGVLESTESLDECHGHTHKITWDGKEVEMYHYHLTYDFPYSVGCFRGKKAVNEPLSQGEGMQMMGGSNVGGQVGRPPMMGPPPR